jgi:UDP-N-acetylglucosamine 2-epimerase (non-hydrolysing)
MKLAPVVHAIDRHMANLIPTGSAPGESNQRQFSALHPLSYRLVHTGQHYDAAMSDIFFRELAIPAPHFNLGVGSGSHAVQTAQVMIGFEKVCLEEKPDWVMVFGDINSTLACTLVAAKLGIRVAHVEAGLRSFDRAMPEEINRVVTDSVADLLLTPSEDANANLRREGVEESRIRLVGNIMIDSLVAHLNEVEHAQTLPRLQLSTGQFFFVTLHRPSNVDAAEALREIVEVLHRAGEEFPVIFAVHPRTRKRAEEFGISLSNGSDVRVIDPVGYIDSLALTRSARCVITDSGGLQEESTWFGTPCLTLRPNTERPVTTQLGSNRLSSPAQLHAHLQDVLNGPARLGTVPPLWDGHTADRVIQAVLTA